MVTWNGLAVELDLDGVHFGHFGREADEALAAAEDLDVVGHLAVVDGDLQLALARLARVHCRAERPTKNINTTMFSTPRGRWPLPKPSQATLKHG